MLGGVAGGLAEYTGIDALLYRVGFVALAFAGGTGVLVYLLLWLLMPAAPGGPPSSSGTRYAGVSTAPAVARAPRGPRSPVPGVTVAGLLIVVGVLVLLTNFTGWDIGPRGFLGAALLVVGVGLVISAFSSGRTARGGLITLGLMLSVALAVASALPWTGFRGGVGDQTFREFDADQVQSSYDCGVGDCTLDLSEVDVSDLDQTIVTRLDSGIGDVQVILPRSADARVSADTGIGSIRIFGQEDRSGGYFPGLGSAEWTDDGDPEFEILVNHGIGDVEVSRA
jgi:phage shock protein PspC (stress-responsive transcriptional regulator)